MASVAPLVHQSPKPLFNVQENEFSDDFKYLLFLTGFVVKKAFNELPIYHLLNVDHTLRHEGYYQQDPDFYLKGSESQYSLDFIKAVTILNVLDEKRKTFMPFEKVSSVAIFPPGIQAKTQLRFKSFLESVSQGYKYDSICFLVKDAASIEETLKTVQENKPDLKNVTFEFLVVNYDKDIFEKGLRKMSQERRFLNSDKKYVVIADSNLVYKANELASQYIPNNCYNGIASEPMKWEEAKFLFGYIEKNLQTSEKATIAWAKSEISYLARQVFFEAQRYRKINNIVE